MVMAAEVWRSLPLRLRCPLRCAPASTPSSGTTQITSFCSLSQPLDRHRSTCCTADIAARGGGQCQPHAKLLIAPLGGSS